MRKAYPSDISRKQFEHILPILESARKKTKPRTVDLYDVFCGLLYILRTGCQWRQLPHDFPKWRTVHSYFQKWSELDEEGNSLLDQALKKIGQKSLNFSYTHISRMAFAMKQDVAANPEHIRLLGTEGIMTYT